MTATTSTCYACLLSESYFGVCPVCKSDDGYLNVGPNHWFYCAEHRARWFVGSNLFSSWREQTDDEQHAVCDRLSFDTFRDVEPVTLDPIGLPHICGRRFDLEPPW